MRRIGWLAGILGVALGVASARAGESAAAELAPSVAEPAWTLLEKMDFEKPGSHRAWLEDKGSRKGARVAFALVDDAHSGKQALRLKLVNPDPPDAEAPKSCTVFVGPKMTALETDATLRVRLFAKGFEGVDADAVFMLIPRKAGAIVNSAYKPEWGKVPAGDDWQEATLQAKLPAGTSSFAFLIRVRKFAPDAALLLDDVTFELKPDA